MDVKRNNVISIDTVTPYDQVHSQIMVQFDNRSVENVSEVKCSVFTDKEDPKSSIVVAKYKDKYLKGVVEQDLDSLCRNYLIIRRKKANKVILVPYSVCHVKSMLERMNTSLDMTDPVKREASYRALCETFGSKKLKRRSNIKARMSIDKATDQQNLTSAIKGVTSKVEEISSKVTDSGQVIENLVPACDRWANVPSQVYNLDTVISPNERLCLQTQAKTLLNQELPHDKLSGLMKGYIALLGSRMTLEKMEILLYVDCLLNYLSLSPAQLKNKSINQSICPYSDVIASKVLKEFSVNRCRPLHLKNKVVCYVLVALLFVNDFQVHMEIVAPCLKGINPKQAIMLLRVVGLTPLSRSDKSLYVLRLPLPALPTTNKKKTSRK